MERPRRRMYRHSTQLIKPLFHNTMETAINNGLCVCMVAEHGTGEDARVLVVSHRSVLNALLNRDDEAPFEMGAVEEVPPTVWRAWGDRGGEGSVDAQSK